MQKYLNINTASELFCFFVALYTLTRVKEPQWRVMPLFMLIICCTELAGIYVENSVAGTFTRNEWLYNLLLLFQAGFINWMFYHLLKDYMSINFLMGAELLILSCFYVFETLQHGITTYNQLTNTIFLVFVSLYSLLYYYFLIRDTDYVHLVTHANFWWVTGIFFFYFGTTACNVFYHQLGPNANNSIKNLTFYVYNAFIFVLYGCWSYSFICKKWETRTSPL
jgi:hypothetical protein